MAGVLALGLLLGASPTLAQDAVTVSMPDTSAAPGDTVAVPVEVDSLDEAEDILSFDIALKFDGSSVSFAGTDEENTLVDDADFSIAENTEANQVSGFALSEASLNDVANSGVLIRLLLVKDESGPTTISLDPFQFNEGEPPVEPAVPEFTLSAAAPSGASDDSYSVQEDASLNVGADSGVLANDSTNVGELTASLVEDVSNGSLIFNQDGSFEYDPEEGFNGTDSFEYEAANSEGTDQATVTITVEATNDPPEVAAPLSDDTLKVPGPPLKLVNLGQSVFTDPDDGDSVSVSATSSNTSVVSVSSNADPLVLQPDAAGQSDITLTATDSAGTTATEVFTVVVMERPAGEDRPAQQARAAVRASDSAEASFGDTGVGASFQDVQQSGSVTVGFVPDSSATDDPSFDESFENVSGYRWDIDNEETVFRSADVTFSLEDADVVGVDDPSALTIVVADGPGGTFGTVTTEYDSDRGVLVASGLTGFSTFRLASNSSDNPPPVEIAAFTATATESGALLQWRTASETGNAGFEVQHRAPDATGFEGVGFVEGAGTTTAPQSYQYRLSDLEPGTHRFRLQQRDTDGSTSLTDPVVRVSIEAERALTLRTDGPNPVRQETQLAFTVKQSGHAEVALYNVLGQQVRQLRSRTATPGERYAVDVDATGLPTGKYFARLSGPSGTRTQQVVVVR
jgi:hypothetical protein